VEIGRQRLGILARDAIAHLRNSCDAFDLPKNKSLCSLTISSVRPKRITVGKNLYEAADARDLADKIGHTLFLFTYCGTQVTTDVEPLTDRFRAPVQEVKYFRIEPDSS
jgi:hypothetical protein